MTQVTVQVDLDHLERLIKSPQTGLAELVWNALDADASAVDVTVETNDLGAIKVVLVTDNGVGMPPDEARKGFGALGGSWKAQEKVSRGLRRALHGSEGKGRFGAFALGDLVRWTSIAQGESGRVETVVTGRRSNLATFDISDPVATSRPTGTTVHIEGIFEKAAKALDKDDKVLDDLAVALALYLESYAARVTWRGRPVSPGDLQDQRVEYPLEVEGLAEPVSVVVIEWKRQVPRGMLLCDSDGMVLHTIQPGIQAPGFDFTAYVRWDGFRRLAHDVLLAEVGHEQVTPVVEAAQTRLRQHFKERASAKQRELLEQWKAEKSYPYKDEPTGTVERARRDLFDVVALAASKAVQTSDAPARRFSLRLLREAVENSPTALNKILQEVLELPKDRLDELHRLLDHTPLTSIIGAAKTIADRVELPRRSGPGSVRRKPEEGDAGAAATAPDPCAGDLAVRGGVRPDGRRRPPHCGARQAPRPSRRGRGDRERPAGGA